MFQTVVTFYKYHKCYMLKNSFCYIR